MDYLGLCTLAQVVGQRSATFRKMNQAQNSRLKFCDQAIAQLGVDGSVILNRLNDFIIDRRQSANFHSARTLANSSSMGPACNSP